MQETINSVVLTEYPAQYVALVRLNRPEARNALNNEVRRQLAHVFTELSGNADIRAIVLTGGDEVFAAGADIKDMTTATTISMYQRHAERYWQAIADCPKPIIAAVNGYALGGGCELAMHADIIIAGEGARFGQPEVKVGVMPGAGGTQRLIRAVGKFQAMRLLFTGCMVKAPEALRMGLVSEMVADGETVARAVEMAQEIAKMPPIAIAQIKEVVLSGMDLPLDAALTLERKAFQLLFSSQDQKEGANAFVEKRTPNYQGE
ncbi:enoyl-CoA hydratase [Stenoxybacter acetivorans]|uniref:enoyl-CoA hydratase n=1 Tax=Stenoxybacter acetivorans TaxID=422441 RepID=UPI00056C24E2|nr:enoyl-CoA hydratase [Stenoxybacter acetivorans]